MELPKEVLELLGKKVKYCKAKVNDGAPSELFKGEGIITGIIIGATKRIQFLVQDKSESKDKAWTLDPICIDPTDEQADSYFEHHKKVREMVDAHNQAQKDREAEKIAEVDKFNEEFFGAPVEL